MTHLRKMMLEELERRIGRRRVAPSRRRLEPLGEPCFQEFAQLRRP